MHLFDLFLCVFQTSSQIACLRGGIFALVAFIWLVSTMCFQMSVHSSCMRIKSGIGCIICSTFLQWFFSNVFSNSQPGRSYSHIGCTCLVFLYHMFSNVPSNGLCERMQCHICSSQAGDANRRGSLFGNAESS